MADGDMIKLRREYLEKQISALAARVRMLKGEKLKFDDESKALYDAVAPTYPDSHFDADPRGARKENSRQTRASPARTFGSATRNGGSRS